MFDQLGEFILREATKPYEPSLTYQIQDKLHQEENSQVPMDDDVEE